MTIPKELILNVFEFFKDEDVIVLLDWCLENEMIGWAESLRPLVEPPIYESRCGQQWDCVNIIYGCFSKIDAKIIVDKLRVKTNSIASIKLTSDRRRKINREYKAFRNKK